MAYQMGRKQWLMSIAYGQTIIAILTIVNTFYPQYLGYTFIIFIFGMIIFTFFIFRTQFKHITSKEAKEIKKGRRLYEGRPEEVMPLQKADAQLIHEMKPMMKAAGISFLNLIIIMIWYPLYFSNIGAIARDPATDQWVRIILFLAGYEVPYGILTLINFYSRRMVRNVIQVVQKYEVYDRGIVGYGGLTVKFPITDYEVRVDPSRKFVELIKTTGKNRVRYRLYSKSYDRIMDIINRYGKPPKSKN
jgi:uncharacterized membrane protein